jgi:hypothetical protein
VSGILIGLLLPAVQDAPRALDSILVAHDGGGLFAGAPGAGRATINWGDGLFSGPFQANFQLKPFVGSQMK